METILIFILCLIVMILACVMYQMYRKECNTLAYLKFFAKSHEMLLWKIHHDIVIWERSFAQHEQYEMAKQAKLASDNIADLIEQYRNELKGD